MDFVNINGHTIHFKHLLASSSGDRGFTFVFINSLGTDFRIWDSVVEQLSEQGNVLLFDNRGHGLSDAVENTVSLDDFADDVVALLEHLSIKKSIPVGLSIGGMIAQILATRIPERIEKLVLCDTGFRIGNAEIWNDRITSVKNNGIAAISDGVMQRWFSEKFRTGHAGKVKGYKNMLERTPVLGYIRACEVIRDADLEEIAKQIKIPSLCVVGSEDKSTTPDEVKNLTRLIEGSRFEIIERSGHIPCVDNPEVLSELIIEFIKS